MKFRLQALVHQGEPDELDIVPRLVRPRTIAAVVVLGAVIAAAVIWSFVGSLPRRVSAAGLLTPQGGLNVVQSTSAGVVQAVDVTTARPIDSGQPLASIVDSSGKTTTITAPVSGQAISISVSPGQAVSVGTPVATLVSRDAASKLDAVLFVPSATAAQIGPGMSVQMSVDVAPQAAFGLLKGHVSAVEPFPVTAAEASGLAGNEIISQTLLHGGPMRLVHIQLQTDPGTASGFAWTTKAGPPFPVLPQSLLHGTVHVSSERPIDLVFGRN